MWEKLQYEYLEDSDEDEELRDNEVAGLVFV